MIQVFFPKTTVYSKGRTISISNTNNPLSSTKEKANYPIIFYLSPRRGPNIRNRSPQDKVSKKKKTGGKIESPHFIRKNGEKTWDLDEKQHLD